MNGGRDELQFPRGRETEAFTGKSIPLTAMPSTDYSTLSYQVFADYDMKYE